MKNFYKVSNTIENGPRMDRVKSRISPINHRLWTVIAPMLFVAFGLFGVNEEMWAWNASYSVTMNSRPTSGGYVSNNNDFLGKKTSATASENENGVGTFKTKELSVTLYAQAVSGYTFTGWSTTENGDNIVSTSPSYTRKSETLWRLNTSQNETLYAIFTPTYTVHFNGNGNTGGSMEDQIFVYGTAKALTSKGFTKVFIVGYNADGGTTATTTNANTKVTYDFDGWEDRGSIVYNNTTYSYTTFDAPYYANTYSDLYAAFGYNKYSLIQHYINNGTGEGRSCKGSTPGLYPNGATVNNLSTTPGATVNLYAHWSASTNYVVLPSATNDGYVLEGWYNGDVNVEANKVGEAGDHYVPSASVTLNAKWVEKYDFTITGNGSYIINNEAWNKTEAFNFVHADEANMTTTIQNTDVISYDRASNTITAKKIGTSKITFTQNTSATVKTGSLEWTITVDSVANNLTVSGTSFTKYVDQEVTSVRSNQNSNGEITTTSSNPNLAHYDITNNKIVIPNSAAQKLPFDDVVITISQAATAKYKAKKHTINLKVEKYANTLYANSSASFAPTMYTDKTLAVTLTATNTDYAGSPISVEQVNAADTTIAKYEYSQASHSGTVTSRQFLASTSWHMTQPENYKYLAGENTFSVTVDKASEATNCYIVTNESDQIEKTVGNWLEDTPGKTINLDSRGSSLTFQARKSRNDAISQLFAQATKNGNDWYDLNTEALDLGTSNNTYGPYDVKDVKSIRFCVKSGGSYTKYIDNICVTRKTYLNVGTDNSSINGTLTINKKDGVSAIYPGEKGQQSTTVYWGIANGGNLKIKCDDPRFTFSQNTITGVDCNSGTTDITVYYTDSVAGTVTATATVYNDVYNRTFTVKGVIEKADQLIAWHNDILRLGQSYTDVATANTLVTYESSDESIIRVDEDGEGHKTILTAVGTGTVNITATAEGSSFFAEKSDVKSIKVTDKQIQWIDWNQSLFGLKLGGANVTMNAVAASDVEGCVSSRLIEYSSSNESVVKVVNNNQLQIIGVGTAIITAVQAGGLDTDGHDYERAETEKTVIVRDPNAPCESFAYQQGQEVKMDCGWNALDKQTRTSEINFNGIIPATGTLRYKGEYRKVAINYFDGTMTVEQYIPDENWQPVTGGDLGKPSIGTYKTANLTFDRRATKMRVKVTDGLGYHYFTDCQVTQARFIETTAPVDFNLNVGQQQNQVIYLSYSNITDGLSLTLAQGANSHFSVDKSFIEGSCGSAAKNVALTITYHPTTEETNAQDVLTITDGTTSCQVVLTGSATRVNRHINWDHADETDIYTVQTETLSAEARTDLNELAGVVTFSLASSSTATGAISMENVLSFTSAGVANVVAYTTDDARYNAAPNVTKVFNVSKTPTTISTLPVLEAVTSGTAVGDVELTGWQVTNTVNGGVVEGTLAITSADLINVGTNTVTLSFTPDNTDMYVGCTSTTTIVVNKATSVATPSAANIVYGQKLNESVLSNEGTEGTWTWTDEKAEDVLDAGTYNDLAVHFTPTSGNYTELDGTVSLTVEKATPVVTAQASAITYGQAISVSELSTATGNISGTWAWAVNEEQVLSVGDHVLKANFTSTNANYNDLSNVDVTLTVNKIEKLEVPVALSFCAGGSVNFHGNTYSEAGEYQVEAEGEIRDTVYNVTVTKLQPTTGTDSKTITVGANESWNGINLSGYAVGSHEVVFHTENVAGCDSTVTLSLTVVPATNIFTNAEGDGDWGNAKNWESGIVPTSDPDIIVTGALEINEDITVHNLTIESTGSVAVISGGTLTVNGTSEARAEYGDVHVMSDGALALGNSADLQVRNFKLDASLGNSSNAGTSGQVSGDSKLHVNGDAYFQMSFDVSGQITYGWYDFVVPFEVDALNGVLDANGVQIVYGTDYIIMNHSEEKRARNQKAWNTFTGTLEPGRIYTITFEETKTWNTFLFKKKAGSDLVNSATYTSDYSSTIGETQDRGWNGFGNGTLQHRELTNLTGISKVQMYNHTENRYDAIDNWNEKALAVGTAFSIQVAGSQSIVLETADANKPLRAQASMRTIDEFRLTLTAEGADYSSDRMWVSASDEATGEYVIGHDLLKMGTPTQAKVAQMWAINNNLLLCDIEMPMANDMAQCMLGLFAPNAGQYILAIDAAPEDANLYLTYNGNIIWDLTASPYVLDLTKGTTTGYGLRIEAANAPQITTGVDDVQGGEAQVRKVIIDNKMYIITPEGAIFDAIGKKVQ